MRKGILLSGLFLIIAMNVQAQQKVGFSNPDDIQPLLDYQLPDWGYSNFFLNFDLNGRLSNNQIESQFVDLDRSNRDVVLNLNPQYNIFRESEKRVISVNSGVRIGYTNQRNEMSSDDSFRERKRFNGQASLNANLREYIRPRVFLLINESAQLEYDDSSLEAEDGGLTDRDEDNLGREIASVTRFGIGTGRVRNVTPVIRALRLRERYGVLANGKNMSSQQVQSAANQFTKFDGYQRRYDRPEKYFWQDMNQAVNKSISGLNPFDLFYLTDVLDENLGRRLEGWDVSVGGEFNYQNILERQEGQLGPGEPEVQRSLDITKTAGFFAEGRWFKNVSLKHQFGFTTSANRTYPIDSDGLLSHTTEIQAQLSWLWNISDRFLLNTNLSNFYETLKLDESEFASGRRRWNNISGVSSNLTYFIENRFAVNAGVSYELLYQGLGENENSFDVKDTLFRFNAGLRYYFSRNLY